MSTRLFVLYFVPFAYTLITRHRSIDAIASWFILNLGFVAIIAWSRADLADVVLLFLIGGSLYEIGYFFNDLDAERQPRGTETRRHTEVLDYPATNFVAAKGVLCALAIAAIDSSHHAAILVLCLLLGAAFWLHNHVRSRLNLGTFFLLTNLKHLFVLSHVVAAAEAVALAFGIPLVRTIEYGQKKAYLPQMGTPRSMLFLHALTFLGACALLVTLGGLHGNLLAGAALLLATRSYRPLLAAARSVTDPHAR